MTSVQTLAMKNLLTASLDETVRRAVERMTERRVGAILVVDDGRLVGIFSERDAMQRVVAAGLDPSATSLAEVCTPEPRVVRQDAPVKDCVDLVRRHGIRHVPVVDEQERPVGILSSRDFLSHVINELEELLELASTKLGREEFTDPSSRIDD